MSGERQATMAEFLQALPFLVAILVALIAITLRSQRPNDSRFLQRWDLVLSLLLVRIHEGIIELHRRRSIEDEDGTVWCVHHRVEEQWPCRDVRRARAAAAEVRRGLDDRQPLRFGEGGFVGPDAFLARKPGAEIHTEDEQ